MSILPATENIPIHIRLCIRYVLDRQLPKFVSTSASLTTCGVRTVLTFLFSRQCWHPFMAGEFRLCNAGCGIWSIEPYHLQLRHASLCFLNFTLYRFHLICDCFCFCTQKHHLFLHSKAHHFLDAKETWQQSNRPYASGSERNWKKLCACVSIETVWFVHGSLCCCYLCACAQLKVPGALILCCFSFLLVQRSLRC